MEQTLILLARYKNLEKVRRFANRAAKNAGLKPDDIFATELAVDEAFSNIIEHAYGGECDEEICCTCTTSDLGINIQLRDSGQPFDPASAQEPDLDASLEDRKPGGLGLYFMRRLMDEVQFEFMPATQDKPAGNLLTMFKRKKITRAATHENQP